MTSRYWIKLYIEILDDPKMGVLPDWLWRRAIELFLAAGENGNDGLLQPVPQLAWRLRLPEPKLSEALRALSEVGVVHETLQGRVVTNFAKRQDAIPDAERQRQKRRLERMSRSGHNAVTFRDVDTDTESDTDTDTESEAVPAAAAADPALGKVFAAYEREIGPLTPMIRDAILGAAREYPPEWFEPAMQEAVRANARNWRYCEAILKRWKAEGFQSRTKKPGGNGAKPEKTFMEQLKEA